MRTNVYRTSNEARQLGVLPVRVDYLAAHPSAATRPCSFAADLRRPPESPVPAASRSSDSDQLATLRRLD